MEIDYIVDTTHTELRSSVEVTYWKKEKTYEIELDSVHWEYTRDVTLTRDELIRVRDSINKILEESAPTE